MMKQSRTAGSPRLTMGKKFTGACTRKYAKAIRPESTRAVRRVKSAGAPSNGRAGLLGMPNACAVACSNSTSAEITRSANRARPGSAAGQPVAAEAAGAARVEDLREPHAKTRRLVPRVAGGAVVREEQLPFGVVQALLERRAER